MSPRPSLPGNRPVLIAQCLIAIAVLMAVAFAATAHAANYKMVLCAANNGSNSFATATNTAYSKYPQGIFDIVNYCGPAPDPAGDNAFLRIHDVVPDGTAAYGAYASASWTVPPLIAILAGGGYTRQPEDFRDGWKARFWAEGFDGSTNNILMQGTNASNSGISWWPTSTFAPHLWPFGGYGYYRRFVYEVTCFRQAGCDRAGHNVSDANTFVLMLADVSPVDLHLINTTAPLLAGQWVRGGQAATYSWSDQGSGIRMEWIDIDNARRFTIDHWNECNTGSSGPNGEFARLFQPCATASNIGRSYTFDTASLADGAHTLKACGQDYAQWKGLDGSGGASCDQRTIRVDNTPPGAPANVDVTSANPQRYLDRFGAQFSLPPNQGSPVAKVHYSVVDVNGDVVVPAKALSATNPTQIQGIEGPTKAGDYRLRVWLEDQVGLSGPAAVVEIPHDTTPPAAPQDISVTAPTTPRSAEGFDLRWRNVADSGSPIDAAHYQVLDGSGKVVVAAQTARGENVQAIRDLETPSAAGSFALRLWLSDEERNVGAPITVPLAYDCMRSPTQGGQQLSAGFGGQPTETVQQGEGATLVGALRAQDGGVATAPICIYSHLATDREREFLGIALTDAAGGYRFPIPAGPSRELSAIYRPSQRELRASATLLTVVHPTLRAARPIVRTGEAAHLTGEIPGPRNDDVVIVLQVKQGDGWLAFRRYRTRGGGHFEADYLFRRTTRPTTYEMRAQVRETTGYPYLEGDSDPLFLRVLPKRATARRACPAGKRLVKRRGKAKCVRRQVGTRKHCAKAKRAKRRGEPRCAPKRGRHAQAHGGHSGRR